MRRTAVLLAMPLLLAATSAHAAGQVVSFGFEWINTSLEPTRADETQRIAMLDRRLDDVLRRHGFALLDPAPVAGRLRQQASLRECGGCDRDYASELGADLAVVGWVQKVSNLILNINLQVRDVATGRLTAAGSVDIRGNDDTSWRRGFDALLERRIFAATGG